MDFLKEIVAKEERSARLITSKCLFWQLDVVSITCDALVSVSLSPCSQ